MMKKTLYILLMFMLITSCEDVIDVDLQTAEPRLVIDASLNWQKGTTGNSQFIKLTLSAPFFEQNVEPANGASVIVTDSNNTIFNFIEDGNTGVYRNETFIPVMNRTYNLTINYQGEVYIGSETLLPVAPINRVEQKNGGGFSGDETEIKAFYTDPKDIENYYFFEFISTPSNTLSLEVYDDEFTDGNEIFAFHSEENLKTGDKLIIRNYGISKRFYEFLNLLLQQSDDDSGDPFETQPATVRGNCINTTNPDNYPFGYFRVSESDIFEYIIQ